MRLILGLPVAGAITIALFLLMRYLILPAGDIIEEPEDSAKISITRPNRDELTRNRDRNKPDRPEQREAPPPPPPMQIDTRVNPNSRSNMAMPDFSGLNLGDLQAPSDRSATPLVQVPPIYPARAQARGTEGWVLIEFNITPSGAVVDPFVIDSDPRGVFDSAALRAIRRWKYRPKIIDSKPVAQFGKEQLITFLIIER